MRILIAISHHGLGHLAQTAPVIDALHAARPDLEFLIWSGVAEIHLNARIHAPFVHRHEPADVGLVMHDAMRVDVRASQDAYLGFHQGWEVRVRHEAVWLRAQEVRAVLSDVACLPLAAAARAGLPGIACCSLNWVDIASAYLADQEGMASVLEEMRAAYVSARAFLRATPAMPMPWLVNAEDVPPIAARGSERRLELRERLGLSQDARLVLLGFGGIAYQTARSLPMLQGVHWLVPDDWRAGMAISARPDLVPFSRAVLPFLDLLASCDALITKVGYGSFVETAAVGIPVIYLDRPDWPESPHLTRWLLAHARAFAIEEAAIFEPGIGTRLAELWATQSRPAVATPGAAYAARRVLELIRP